MARLPRVVIPQTPHHIIQRSVRGVDLFENDDDRMYYLSLMKTQGLRVGVKFLAYCLMRDHVHLIAVPGTSDSLSKCIGEAHRLYTRRINARQNVTGYLFQGRFLSCAFNDEYLSHSVNFVERNPVRNGICKTAIDFHWSSARFHSGIEEKDPLIGEMNGYVLSDNWTKFLERDPEHLDELALHFRTGRPLGDDDFLSKAEELTGRKLKPKKRGRPKKLN